MSKKPFLSWDDEEEVLPVPPINSPTHPTISILPMDEKQILEDLNKVEPSKVIDPQGPIEIEFKKSQDETTKVIEKENKSSPTPPVLPSESDGRTGRVS